MGFMSDFKLILKFLYSFKMSLHFYLHLYALFQALSSAVLALLVVPKISKDAKREPGFPLLCQSCEISFPYTYMYFPKYFTCFEKLHQNSSFDPPLTRMKGCFVLVFFSHIYMYSIPNIQITFYI